MVLLGVSLAAASDLPVTYAVQEKALKVSGVVGTPLTFALYSDNVCTNQVYQAVVPIENVALISRLKQLTAKGAVKGPTTDELKTTLTGVPAIGNLFLTVTGAGVTASGPTCQAQAAASITPGGSPPLFLRDGNNTVLGVAPVEPSCGSYDPAVPGSGGCVAAFYTEPTHQLTCSINTQGLPVFCGFQCTGTLYFSGAGCTGTKYLPVGSPTGFFSGPITYETLCFEETDLVSTAIVYVGVGPGSVVPVMSQKAFNNTGNNGACSPASTPTISGTPVTQTYDFSNVVPPFSVGP
jgi:hypothetical protein